MTPATALLDANALYPAPLRDLLLQMSFDGLFQARWTAEIESEWKRNLLARRPELVAQVDRTQAVMRRAIPAALVTGYSGLIADLSLPDPDDRHVLAAAITASAATIVTFNLRDFPPAALASYGIEAQHPDCFLTAFALAMPRPFLNAVRECLARLTSPPVSAGDYLAAIRRLGLCLLGSGGWLGPKSVAGLRRNHRLLCAGIPTNTRAYSFRQASAMPALRCATTTSAISLKVPGPAVSTSKFGRTARRLSPDPPTPR